jgi:hypothetical protein
MSPADVAAAPRVVTAADPVLVPSAIPDDWTAEVAATAASFTVWYRGSQGQQVMLAVSVPNPEPPIDRTIQDVRQFRGDPRASYEIHDPSDPTSMRYVIWKEPGRYTDPISMDATSVPYYLTTRGIGESQFWTIADSLQPAATGSSTTIPVAQAALDAYVTSHPDVVTHSAPARIGDTDIAVVAWPRTIAVLDLTTGTANQVAQLRLPPPNFELSADLPVQYADVTGDGPPDFLVRVVAADNSPGVLASDDGGTWRLVPVSPTSPDDVYIGRNPQFAMGHLFSDINDCTPSCASGRTTATSWTYERTSGGYLHRNP